MERRLSAVTVVLSLVLIVTVMYVGACGQSSVNYTGNGGTNTVQGRLIVPTGQRAEIAGIKIRLQNLNAGDLSVITDDSGAFAFKNLTSGSYVVILEGNELFEDVLERVHFDDLGSSTLGDPALRIANNNRVSNVQMFLKPRAHASEGAAAVLDAKWSEIPKAAKDKLNEAQKALAAKDTKAAIADLRESVAIAPKFAPAWEDLGLLLGSDAQREESVKALRSAVTNWPENAAYLLNLGTALVQQGNWEEAETFLAASLSKDRTLYMAHYYLGMTEIKLGRLDVGEQAMLKAIELGGTKVPRAHYYLGGIYWANKQYAKAADQLEKYLAADPRADDADKVKRSIAELRSKT